MKRTSMVFLVPFLLWLSHIPVKIGWGVQSKVWDMAGKLRVCPECGRKLVFNERRSYENGRHTELCQNATCSYNMPW